VALEFIDFDLAPRLAASILSASVMLLAFLSLSTGLTLESLARGREDAKRLNSLNLTLLDRDRRNPAPVLK